MSNQIPKFPLGQVVATTRAMFSIPSHEMLKGLARHSQGDWGDVCPEDQAENEFSLEKGFRLLSAYHTAQGLKFWIITEGNRSATTILLPDDY